MKSTLPPDWSPKGHLLLSIQNIFFIFCPPYSLNVSMNNVKIYYCSGWRKDVVNQCLGFGQRFAFWPMLSFRTRVFSDFLIPWSLCFSKHCCSPKMKLLSASLLVLWSCLVYNVQQSCANHWHPSPEKALASVSENGSFATPDSMLTLRLVVVFYA